MLLNIIVWLSVLDRSVFNVCRCPYEYMFSGLGKKIDAIAKRKECSDISLWRGSIINHLYYVATKANGFGELALSMWRALINHIQDIHEGHSDLYPVCDHGPLTEANRKKQWIMPGEYIL